MRTRLLAMLVGGVLVVAGCEIVTQSSAAPDARDPGLAAQQVLKVDISGEPPTLDPTRASGGGEITVLKALHESLVGLDERLEVVPALAQDWDISADAKTLTFHLREAHYSNGDAIVSADFVSSWKRLVDPRTAAPYSSVMADVVGAPELFGMNPKNLPSDAEIDAALGRLGIEAPDARTLIVRLNRPATYFLSALTLWVFAPLQEDWITSENATEAGNHVSSGPFVLDRWDHERSIVLKQNPHWSGHVKPTLTEIRISMHGEPAQAQLAYDAGELDIVVVPAGDIERIGNDPALAAEYAEINTLGVSYLAFNNYQDPGLASFADPGPTSNKDFRIALTQAIDKEAFIDASQAGLGRVANSIVMPGIPGHQPDLNPYPYDLDLAQNHMDTALAALGAGSSAELGQLRLGYATGHDSEPEAAFLVEAWRRSFGLEVDLILSDLAVFQTQRAAGEYDIARTGWGADFPHAHNQLAGLFTCSGGLNDVQYCNPAFDDLIASAAAEPDGDRQQALYEEAQTLLMGDAVFLPLEFGVTPYMAKPHVSGLRVTPAFSQVPGDDFYETIRILDH
jgi:oligopeptide transport system substrate-binding protein